VPDDDDDDDDDDNINSASYPHHDAGEVDARLLPA
jgi:hypothetical protein